jgi:hypothetical protein
MVIADAAPWYYVRFHQPPATRYFALARAYTPARQRELIEALRARPVQALLLPAGYGSLRDFDLPDALRLPVADAYLRARREGVAPVQTPLGDLYFWNEVAAAVPASSAPPARPAGVPARVEVVATLVTYQPAAVRLFARGWALEAVARRPLAALRPRELPPGVAASLEYGASVPDTDAAGPPRRIGWELVCRGLRELPAGGALALEAVTAGGGTARVQLDLAGVRRLGPLSGAEWHDLGGEMDRAAALGRADRVAALDRAAARGRADRAAARGERSESAKPAAGPPRRSPRSYPAVAAAAAAAASTPAAQLTPPPPWLPLPPR